MSFLHLCTISRRLRQNTVGRHALVVSRVAPLYLQSILLQESECLLIIHSFDIGYGDTLTMMGIDVQAKLYAEAQYDDYHQHSQDIFPEVFARECSKEILCVHILYHITSTKVQRIFDTSKEKT